MIYDKLYIIDIYIFRDNSWARFGGHKQVRGGWEIKNLECFLSRRMCTHANAVSQKQKNKHIYYGTCEMWTSVIMTGYRQRRKPPSFLSIMVSVSGSASRGFVRCVIPFPTFVLKSTSQLDYVRFVPFSIASSFPLSFTYFFNIIFRQKIRWIHWAFSKFWTTSNIFYFFFF